MSAAGGALATLLVTLLVQHLANRRHDRERRARLASELLAAVAALQGAHAAQRATLTSWMARGRAGLMALVEFLSASGGRSGLMSAARSVFRWGMDGAAAAELSVAVPLDRMIVAWSQLRVSGDRRLAQAADAVVVAALDYVRSNAKGVPVRALEVAMQAFVAAADRSSGTRNRRRQIAQRRST